MLMKDREEDLIPITQISKKDRLDKELIRCRNDMPFVPPFVLKLRARGNNDVINGMVVVLQN